MNTLTQLDPVRRIEDLQNHLATLFGRPPVRQEGQQEESMTVAEWAPLVDISEDDKEYLVKAELPGIKKEDVHISVEKGVLTITGERKFEKEDKKHHRVERAYGRFVRTFIVPDDAEADKVHAEFKDGLLTIHIPKSEQAKPKQIEVRVE